MCYEFLGRAYVVACNYGFAGVDVISVCYLCQKRDIFNWGCNGDNMKLSTRIIGSIVVLSNIL